ncbi:hypothetical protein [Actinoplanes sp. NPDC049118]|uniref:hypothetical protein n=1 Tax=Actinoplanes sp. NPDC049118 TaxID=3155769 RepID=UPI0033EEB2DE
MATSTSRTIRSRTRHRITTLIASVALLLTLSLVGGQTSAAAVEVDDWTQSCSSWSEFQLWQVQDEWARVSHRSCIVWTTHTAKVRAATEFRVDWPNIVNCSASIGSKPACAVATLKDPTFRLNSNGLLSFLWYDLGGSRRSESDPVRCQSWQNVHKTWGFNGSAPRKACNGRVFYIRDNTLGSYTVNSKHFGDRLNDGDGWKGLTQTGDYTVKLRRSGRVTTLAG